MFKAEVLQFLKDTQPKQWEKLSAIHGNDLENRIIQRLYKEMDLRGSLDVIRNGFVDYGVRFKCAFFKPESGLNPDTIALYNKNRLKVIRQVYYSKKNKNSVDLVLSLNGLPVATLELKNRFTGRNTTHAKRQYGFSRDNMELLFAFKKRALVHFAVDDEAIYMTTRIERIVGCWIRSCKIPFISLSISPVSCSVSIKIRSNWWMPLKAEPISLSPPCRNFPL